jgi:hypothetical protein
VTKSVNLVYDGAMDINKILSELRAEREQIEQAILVLQGLAQGQRRRGRKPAWMKQAEIEPKKRRGRPPGSQNRPRAEVAQ